MPDSCELNEEAFEYLDPIVLDIPTAIFVESRAAESAGSAIGGKIDYGLLLEYLRDVCPLVSAKYYWSGGMREEDVGAGKFLKYLSHVGWDTWFSKPHPFPLEAQDTIGIQGAVPLFNPRVKLAVDAMNAVTGAVQQVILFARGSDFVPLIEALQARGIRVVCVGWTDRHGGADGLLDLRKLVPAMGEIVVQ